MDIKLDHRSTHPLYEQIERQLRVLIQQKEYLEGKKLPNEVDMARNLCVARSTIRQAINKLVNEGLLVRKKATGTFVSQKPISSKVHNWLSFSQEMALTGVSVCNYELHISWSSVDEEVANFFQINPETKVLRLERVRGSEETPFVHFISFFNPKTGMTGDEDFSTPLYTILEQRYNIRAKTSVEEIGAKLADATLAEKLRTHVGSAILKRKRYVYDANDHPIEWNVGYYRADSFVYSLESDRVM